MLSGAQTPHLLSVAAWKVADRTEANQSIERRSAPLSPGSENGDYRGGVILLRTILTVASAALMSTTHTAWAQPPAQQSASPGMEQSVPAPAA